MNRNAFLPIGGEIHSWLVAFLDTDGPVRSWQAMLRPGFRHCIAYGFDGRCWLQVDCMMNLLDVRSYAEPEMTIVLDYLGGKGAVILAAEPALVSRVMVRWPMYCVSTVKHLLGLRAWWAFTPWLLFNAMRARGARLIDLGDPA